MLIEAIKQRIRYRLRTGQEVILFPGMPTAPVGCGSAAAFGEGAS
jgi:hypothetical protein